MSTPQRPKMSPDDLIASLRERVTEMEDEIEKLRRSAEVAGTRIGKSDQHLEFIHALLDDAPIGFVIFSPDFRFQVVNKRLAKLNGIAAEKHIGRTIEEVVPHRAAQARQIIRQVMETGRPVLDREFVCATNKDPETARSWSESWYPMTVSDGRLLGVGCILTEITGRKAAEEALRQSELLNKQVLENLPECIFVLDVTLEGRFKFAGFNPAEERAVGYSTEQVSGKFVEDVLDKETAKKVIAHYQRCLKAGALIDYDDELSLPTGLHYFHTNLIPVRNAEGRIHRIVGCCSDLTEVRRMQEEALARQKLESMGLLATGIAHDFNNLLGGILASSELALAEHGEGAAVDEELQRIKTASMRGSEIVRQLMIYGGNENPVFEPVDVSLVIEEILQLIKVSISKQVALQLDLGKNLPPTHANPAQLRQIVMNLVTNASEAIGERQGLIRISLERVRVAQDLELTGTATLPKDDYLKLEVADTGSGMSPEVQARIFDPFYTTKQAGRGLGLAVVQGILRAHGGAINVISAPVQGTTIQVFLPYANKSARVRQRVKSSVPKPGSGQTGTILMVEDEDLLRTALSKLLRKTGYSVIEARDGSAAIELLGTYKDGVDLILLDVSLPGISSRQVLEEAQKMLPGLRVVITSAYSKETVDASLAGLPVFHFIRKPFRLDELLPLLRSTLSA